MTAHILRKCPKDCDGCAICDGGLAECAVCEAAECQLATECPGVPTTEEQRDGICRGELDFKNGKWEIIV